MPYLIRRARTRPSLTAQWDSPPWSEADILEINHFHPKSSSHRPQARAKLLHDEDALYVQFEVHDQYVRSAHQGYHAPVCKDSCAELFITPRPGRGYFNFEINCGGALLSYFIEDSTRIPGGFAKFTRLPPALLDTIRIHPTMPPLVDPEIPTPTTWRLEYSIPRTVFETYLGPLGPFSAQQWHGNLFKCGDQTSHPHWASWAPIGEKLNFHQPQFFAPLMLE